MNKNDLIAKGYKQLNEDVYYLIDNLKMHNNVFYSGNNKKTVLVRINLYQLSTNRQDELFSLDEDNELNSFLKMIDYSVFNKFKLNKKEIERLANLSKQEVLKCELTK